MDSASLDCWACCECLRLNAPRELHCQHCGKQHWVQLGISENEAQSLFLSIRRDDDPWEQARLPENVAVVTA